MIDPTDFELKCMEGCLKYFGEYVEELGFARTFGSLSKEEALTIIEVVVTAYEDAMREGSEEIPF